MGSSANGNMRRIINFLKNLQKQQTKYKSGIKNFKSELMILQMNLKKNLHTLTVSPNVNPNLENFVKRYTIVWEKAVIVFCDFNSSQKHICKFVNVYKIIDFILKTSHIH